jgi:hypothetical protein
MGLCRSAFNFVVRSADRLNRIGRRVTAT